jgi:hypothetical protein
MAPTKSFKRLIETRVARHPVFRNALLRVVIEALSAGNADIAKAILGVLA